MIDSDVYKSKQQMQKVKMAQNTGTPNITKSINTIGELNTKEQMSPVGANAPLSVNLIIRKNSRGKLPRDNYDTVLT